MPRVPAYAVLNALGICIAIIGSGFAGGGLWTFAAAAAIFSVRGQRYASSGKESNTPAAAAVLLVPVMLKDLGSVELALFWTAFITVAVIPFTVVEGHAGGTAIWTGASPVTLWTIWGENSRTRLDAKDQSRMLTVGSGGAYRQPRSRACTAQTLMLPVRSVRKAIGRWGGFVQ